MERPEALGFLGAALAVRGLPGGDAAGRVLGAVLLGLALGLMLALAERIARAAWLEVQYGGGESRTVNLGVEPVSIGSDSRASTIDARVPHQWPIATGSWTEKSNSMTWYPERSPSCDQTTPNRLAL